MPTSPVRENRSRPRPDFPLAARYCFAQSTEPITILALAPRGEVRALFRDGSIRTLPEHRIRVDPEAVAA